MVGREIVRRARRVAVQVVLLSHLVAPVWAVAEVVDAPTAARKSDPRAGERFRAASALETRELYDLAAQEFAALTEQYPDDLLASQARLRRGACLFQLEQFALARGEFQRLLDEDAPLDPALAEPSYAYLGLTEYNLGQAADGDEQAALLRSAIARFDEQLRQFPSGTLAAESAFYRTEALYITGQLDEAAQAYRDTLAAHPQHSRRDELCYALGVTEHELGRYGAAAKSLGRFIAEFPSHEHVADANLRRGESLLAIDRPAEAEPCLVVAAAAEGFVAADRALELQIQCQLAADNSAAAVELCSQLLARFPESARADRALLLRGQLQAASQKPTLALSDFARLVAEWPESRLVPQALLARARAEVELEQLAAAEASLDQLLDSYDKDALAIEARQLRAAIRHQQGDFAGGLVDATAVLATDPPQAQRSDAAYTRGLCELGLGRPADAAATFSEITRHDPQYRALDRVLYDLAWAQRECGNTDESTITFKRLVADFPASPLAAESWYHVGEADYAARDFVAAAKSFSSTGERASRGELSEKAQHKLAWSSFERQQWAAAEAAFDKQLVDHPQGSLAADAKMMIGECRYQQEQYGTALEAFTAAIEQLTASESLRELALLHAGQAAAQLHQWERSLALFEIAAHDFPRGSWASEARYERGWALYHLDRFDEAQPLFEAVAADNSDLLGARAEFMVGEVHFARKQFDDAVRRFFNVAYGYGDVGASSDQTALENHTTHQPLEHWQAEALFEAARALEATNRYEAAGKLYEELLERFPASRKAEYAADSLQRVLRR